jgi:thiol-disulfide isomerase/thioredoxin
VILAGRRGTALRWGLVVAVLAVGLAVALWPRSAEPPGSGDRLAGRDKTLDLDRLRQQAALAPCPAVSGPAGSASMSPLAAVRVPCLRDGSPVELGSALAGRPVLLNMWSHTCEPCREELPVLQRYASEPDAVEVLGVQVEGSPQAGLAMLTALGVRLPSVTDPEGVLRAALGAPQVLPLTYLVGRDGTVQMVNPPVVFRSPDEVGDTVRQYLAEATRR